MADLVSRNYHDAIELGRANNFGSVFRSPGVARIFGNANIGNGQLSNLQVPGRLSENPYRPVIVQRWYARTNIPDVGAAWEEFCIWSHSVKVQLRRGPNAIWGRSLYELIKMIPRTDGEAVVQDPWPCHFPSHEIVSVALDAYAGSDHLEEILQSEVGPFGQRWFVWVHLDGVEFAGSSKEFKKLAGILERSDERQASETQRIAAWILRESRNPLMKPEDAAQLVALHDGIQEGRHR